MRKIIDYSQLSSWFNCPWYWYERYVKGMSSRYTGQRDDALALGSLVHEMLDNWSKTGRPFISIETLTSISPTPECLQIAEIMTAGYIQRYPSERWPVERTEEAVEFPLYEYKTHLHGNDIFSGGWSGIAKLDGYFYVPEDTIIESGIPGITLTLGRGWWSREYKTKSPSINRGVWMQEWASKRQADFQLLALQNLLHNGWKDATIRTLQAHNPTDDIRGVLVSVLEKPREYTPRRKCKGCSDTYDLSSFRVVDTGHACPMCGHVQHLKPYTPAVPSSPDYFRMTVTRTPEQLEVARREILQVAQAMDDMVDDGMSYITPNRDNCIQNRWHRKCEFAENHIAGREVGEPEYIQIDPYQYIGKVL